MEIFPEFHLFPRMERIFSVAKRLGGHMLPSTTELCLSEHHRGAEEMLADLQEQLPFEPHAVSEGWLKYDESGNYIDPLDF